ncbi:insulinase family protein [Aetokthonos hydrillicola Thurmond2011]|jgi:zinc protease|uniref:Insulinase family protein n=1 Tax=Aetokthonos hydrillicola Thurmond2011 TaxID=2712845 RepID=A0AAP5M618_9CYAN|nr:pitrilysin family protein [Aetokthonos hydrillicola]MBO3457394.1 insulinase family protein [Aetokthonos hydrillicola CCALA 1050]MBW4589465.1 insulinase family protein [Aetokthonos hydrillicola CCALA 1050]MDR9893690.1 insulinase family protein [Aetokthonos hydrillicola Thurmond2011]
MSVFYKPRRRRFYRFRSFLLIFGFIFLLSVGGESAYSHLIAVSKWVNFPNTEVSKKTSVLLTENVRKTTLENGLTVLTKEVHTSPVVTVQVWYKVGSRSEEPGVNGIAHQLEHMMFRGTKNRPIQFGQLFNALGSDSNAFTSYDQTAYYNTVEPNKLKALLTLEADRMDNSVIDTSKLEYEKRVVISELQGYENSPNYRLNRAVMRKAFPNHPYGLPVGGLRSDVEKFQVEQVRKYYRNFYSPDNAVLVIVGDFQTAPTLKAVKQTFGKISKQKRELLAEAQRRRGVEEQGSKRAGGGAPTVLKEPGAGKLLEAIYPLPNVNHPDVPALNVMDNILTEGKSSRLYQALVEAGLASDVSASVVNISDFGWYDLSVTAVENQNLTKIDSTLSDAIAYFIQKGPTAEEVKRAKTQLEASVVLGNLDITSQATQLGNDETTSGDYRYTDRYLAAVRQVTVADVQRVASKYLKQQVRTVGFFEPTKQVETASSKTNSTQTTERFASGTPVSPKEIAKYLPPVDWSYSSPTTRTLPQELILSNKLRVLLLPDKNTPTVTLNGFIKAGTEFDPDNKVGLSSLVAQNLMNGTKTKDVLTIAKSLDDRGASLTFKTYREGVQIQGNSLATDLSVLIKTLADVIKNPTFPAKELELSRQNALTSLKQELDDPSEVAKRTFAQSVYPKKHPAHKFPTQESLQAISRKDLIDFKTKLYRPDTTVLSLVGDFAPQQVRSLLTKEFGDWKVNGQPPNLTYPAVSLPKTVVSLNPVIPGKTQAITYMGSTAINRKDPRYYAATVLNQILGGDTLSSRLGAEIRDRQGLTYGIYSNFMAGKNAGTFLIEMQTSPEDTTAAVSSTRQVLKQITEQGVTELEVETAKRALLSSYTVSLANPDELGYKILMNEVYALSEEELRAFREKIQAVSVEQVNQAARELLHPDTIVVVTAGPSVVGLKNPCDGCSTSPAAVGNRKPKAGNIGQ